MASDRRQIAVHCYCNVASSVAQTPEPLCSAGQFVVNFGRNGLQPLEIGAPLPGPTITSLTPIPSSELLEWKM